MYRVCAIHCGRILLLEEFEDKVDAVEFMKNDCLLADSDETEDGSEEWVYADEMFIEGEIPFSDPLTKNELKYIDSDEMPF